ncbi:MAG: FAD-binding oxidoreductase, partial [Elioraea sp.]|nr:FAD-binding oxidoreductase [Elioraea sp.]
DYGLWTIASARAWPSFAAALREESGIDVGLRQDGGYTLFLREDDVADRAAALALACRRMPDQSLLWDVQERARLARALPGVGPDVAGGLYCPLDGEVNILRVMRALHVALRRRGVSLLSPWVVERVEPLAGGGFLLRSGNQALEAAKVVLAAGLGNRRLAPWVGLSAPLRPQRGHIMVTARLPRLLPVPTVSVRQTDEGSVLIGESKEEQPEGDGVRPGILAAQARRAIRLFPALANAAVVRSWAGMRVMTPDGLPLYDQSALHPGAFVVACHSGVTLAAIHAGRLAAMIAAGRLGAEVSAFSATRFDVLAAA